MVRAPRSHDPAAGEGAPCLLERGCPAHHGLPLAHSITTSCRALPEPAFNIDISTTVAVARPERSEDAPSHRTTALRRS